MARALPGDGPRRRGIADGHTGRLRAVRTDGTRCLTGWLAAVHEFPQRMDTPSSGT